MGIVVRHNFQSAVPDKNANGIIKPTQWNEAHVITLEPGVLMGRYSPGVGNAQEITPTGAIVLNSTTGNLDLGPSGVTAGVYTSADITVDAYGRVTSAANGANISGFVTQAREWAENPEDDDITGNPGHFSALHWANKSEGHATNAATAETYAETAETNAETAQAAAEAAQAAAETNVTYAEEWAINPHNDPVSVAAGGDNSTTFSALHWATEAAASAASLTTEAIQDIVGAMVSGNTETGLSVTYQDGDGTLDFEVTGVLASLNTLGQPANDGEIIVATGAGAFAYESGATARASLGLTIGTHVQAFSANLSTYAGIAPSANAQTILGQTFAQMRASLDLEAGTDFYSIAGADAAFAAIGRQIISGSGLTGGGTLAADRTLAVGAGTGITVNADDVAITANGVTNSLLATAAQWTIKVRNAGSTGNLSDAALADFTEEGSPAAGMFLLGWLSTGELRKFDIDNLPGGGVGMSDLVDDTSPQLGGDLDTNGFDIIFTDDEFIGTGTSAGNQFHLAAYDVNGTAYVNFISFTANDTPTCDLSTAVTIGGNAILDASDIGVSVQAYSANLDEYAGVNPSANTLTLLGSADFAAWRASLDLEAGTDFYSVAGADAAFAAIGRQIISGSGLTGGGTLAADRTLVVGAGTGITVNADDVAVSTNTRTGEIAIVIGNGVDDITTGTKGYIPLDFAGNFTAWTVVGDASGAIVIDVWKAAGARPTNSDSITGSDKPTLSGPDDYAIDTSITWTSSGAFSAGDVLGIEVESVSGLTQVTLTLRAVKSS
jgi:hypothetical protein